MSRELILNFYQWKTFSEKCKLIGVRLWIALRITKKNCLLLVTEFVQTQERYPTSFEKINIVT